MRLYTFICLFLGALLVFTNPHSGRADASFFGERESLLLTTKSGEYTFQVEIADTSEKRSRGLMWRESMKPTHGMLFDFGNLGPVSMWMENTILSLDMVFIKPDGVVHRVERNTKPFSRDIITSGGPVSHVLELNAGIALQIGLEKGDRLTHRYFAAEN